MSIAIKLAPELETRLENLAKKTHRSKSFYAREAIEHYIEDLEDYYLGMQIKDNPGKIYTSEEVKLNKPTSRAIDNYLNKKIANSPDPRAPWKSTFRR